MARLSAESRRGRARAIGVALIASLLIVGSSAAPVLAGDPPPPLEPIDPQVVTQAADQTWADYHPIPGSPYADPSIEPLIERFDVALILTDFPDTPFVITQPQGSTVFGNPGALAHDIPRDAVPAFYRRLAQRAQRDERVPGHEPLLDGRHLWQVRRGPRGIRPVPAAG